jgi:hypothetical protein
MGLTGRKAMQELSFCWPLKLHLQEHLNRCGDFLLWRSLAESIQRKQNYEKTTQKSVRSQKYLFYFCAECMHLYTVDFISDSGHTNSA